MNALAWLAALVCVIAMIAAAYAVTTDDWLPHHVVAHNAQAI